MCEGNLSHSLLIYQQSVLCLFVLQLESLNQSELASRLTMNCQNSYVEPHKIKDIAVTIMDVGLLYTLLVKSLKWLRFFKIVFERSLLWSLNLHLFDQKYSKNSNIVMLCFLFRY